jgi:hypothetical protein
MQFSNASIAFCFLLSVKGALQYCISLLNFLLFLWQTFEASNVFEHLVSLGVKPNAMSYSLLVDAHLINRDTKAAVLVIDKMVMHLFPLGCAY